MNKNFIHIETEIETDFLLKLEKDSITNLMNLQKDIIINGGECKINIGFGSNTDLDKQIIFIECNFSHSKNIENFTESLKKIIDIIGE